MVCAPRTHHPTFPGAAQASPRPGSHPLFLSGLVAWTISALSRCHSAVCHTICQKDCKSLVELTHRLPVDFPGKGQPEESSRVHSAPH